MIEFGEVIEVDDKHYYKISTDVKETLNITQEYFPISVESLNNIIDSTVNRYNNDVDIVIDNSI